MSKLSEKVKAAVKKVTTKKVEVVKEKVEKVCGNCNGSGMTCSVCHLGRDN